jgi:anti-sigma factor RsiW
MSVDACADMRLLIQADHDGELDAAGAARVAAHVVSCPACAAYAASLQQLSGMLRAEIVRPELPPRLLQAAARMAAPPPPARWQWVRRQSPGFAAGLALAASVALVALPRAPDLANEAVAAHIRALQPGHLMDVASTDRHTVKPWFAGRLDYAPPVRDFAGVGFPLKGGRLDVFAGRPVAALVYGRDKHLIDVLVWPGTATAAHAATLNGYNIVTWSAEGMQFYVVSDLNQTELRDFAKLWQ